MHPFAHHVPLCRLLLRVVGSCCPKFETGETFSYVQTDATAHNIVDPRLLEKTLAGASFTQRWLLDFVSPLHDDWDISYRVNMKILLMLIKYTSETLRRRYPFESTGWPILPGTSDTVAKFRYGVKFSLRYNNRGKLTPVRLAQAWHLVVVSYH